MQVIVGGPLYPQPPSDGDKIRWAALLPELAALTPLHGIFGLMPPKERRDQAFDRSFARLEVAGTSALEVAIGAGFLELRRHPSAYGRRATRGWRRLVEAAAAADPRAPVLLLGPSGGSIGALPQPAALDLLDVRSRFRTIAGDQVTRASILRAEVALARRFTILLASESDRGWLLRNGADPARTKVVPHGADRRFLEIVPDPASRTVLFVGNLHYPPNLEGLSWFLRGCWPAMRGAGIELRLVLFGAERAGKPPETTIFADVEDVRPHYAAAAIAVAPLLSARGTQFKVLEAMAAGLPVVCTTPVAEGLFDDHPAIVCDQPSDFAAACRGLLADAARRRELGERGRAYVRRHHDWAQSARLLFEILVG
jgi:hypothetical protein